jgi:hypothetical protein
VFVEQLVLGTKSASRALVDRAVQASLIAQTPSRPKRREHLQYQEMERREFAANELPENKNDCRERDESERYLCNREEEVTAFDLPLSAG